MIQKNIYEKRTIFNYLQNSVAAEVELSSEVRFAVRLALETISVRSLQLAVIENKKYYHYTHYYTLLYIITIQYYYYKHSYSLLLYKVDYKSVYEMTLRIYLNINQERGKLWDHNSSLFLGSRLEKCCCFSCWVERVYVCVWTIQDEALMAFFQYYWAHWFSCNWPKHVCCCIMWPIYRSIPN